MAAEREEDHRATYLDYEGVVSGGRGTVRRVSAGQAEVVEIGLEVVVVRLRGGRVERAGQIALPRVMAGRFNLARRRRPRPGLSGN